MDFDRAAEPTFLQRQIDICSTQRLAIFIKRISEAVKKNLFLLLELKIKRSLDILFPMKTGTFSYP